MKSTIRFTIAAVTLLTLLLAGSVTLYGYGSLDYLYSGQVRSEHWENASNIPWWIDAGSYSAYYSACQASFNTWQDVTYTDFTFQYQGTTSQVMDADDGINVVSMNSTYGGWGSILGFTVNYTVESTGEIYGFDVILNPGTKWSTDGTPKSTQYELESIVTHELGHAQGLCHSVVYAATMYPFASPGSVAPSTLEIDDVISHALLYGNATFPGPFARFEGSVVRGGTGAAVPGACVHSFPPTVEYYSENITCVYTHADGDYVLYAPAGDFLLRLDPLDADPAAYDPLRISELLMAIAEVDFEAEWYNAGESNCEDATQATTYTVAAGEVLTGFTFVTNDNCGGTLPVADFSGSPTSGTAPLTVTFSDLSSGNPTSWYWEFGDGGTSASQNPVYTYDDPGVYTVRLTVINEYGSDLEEKTDYISVSGGGETVMHVSDMTVESNKTGQWRGYAHVTIVDQYGGAVAGATVSGFFNAPNTSTKTGTTGSDGVATIVSDKTKTAPSDWCFEVTDVALSGASYDPNANDVTSACESGPVFKGIVAVPEAYQLQQNVPNPFNPTTDITFALPHGGQVLLQVFDVTGRNVCDLVDGYLGAGPHSVTWNSTDTSGRRVASGVYFYRLSTSEFSQTRKMMLLK